MACSAAVGKVVHSGGAEALRHRSERRRLREGSWIEPAVLRAPELSLGWWEPMRRFSAECERNYRGSGMGQLCIRPPRRTAWRLN